ncbi:MAG: 2Fe-2S iron-sulfur cluster binding domain-containing protein [Candidatus Lokiarchaeota archaeon]|nr:2Fe-2S iron-sulfur cluster binding domain-containing protein [Candidatus Lokiarchaeota archaeon]MBD3201445.1 2Fe-2S iron-sulfur cluster binding domain-containing protein [Candidatus Lokiarchaeota archaeon]
MEEIQMNDEKEELKVKIKGKIRDLLAFSKLTSTREKKFKKASATPIEKDDIKELSEDLHPKYQYLEIKEIRDNTKSSKTFKLIPNHVLNTRELAYFRAGQYLSLKVNVDGHNITRPYTISSSPSDALEGFYEITIKREEDGFLTNYIFKNWEVGTKITASDPQGFLYYQPLRDLSNIVGIAGGSGITAFRSIAKDIVENKYDLQLTILYGCSEEDDILFFEELKELEKKHPEKIKLVIILSCQEVKLEGCEQGFITSELIEKHCKPEESTFFICGPQAMYDFVDKEIEKLGIAHDKVRKEVYGEVKNIAEIPAFPKNEVGKTYKIKVQMGNLVKEIPANSTDSILVSLEKAKLAPPSSCRSGECGYCRSILVSGNIFVNPKSDGRREADKLFNSFHPCSSYPISNIEIVVPRKK